MSSFEKGDRVRIGKKYGTVLMYAIDGYWVVETDLGWEEEWYFDDMVLVY